MRLGALLIVAAALFLAGNAAGAADFDILAMHGNAGDGKTEVNLALPFRRGFFPDGKDGGAARPESVRMAEDGAAESVSPRFDALPYVGWKNGCAPAASIVAGETIAVEPARGFARVAPYAGQPAPVTRGYLDILAGGLRDGP